ncbi:MAG: response regulator transcription factor [Limnohabitans sp.]|mgnify:FL=1|jgi:DNA-binding NarL/FixJ family response regulator|nr:response regulator transcription factor [Limnohabitans sp.]
MSLYVIDDHPLVRQAIGMLLRRLRPANKVVELEKLSELQAAIIKNGAPQLFVLDLLLPGVKGASAVSDIKGMYPEVPLAVISAMPAGEAEETCIEAGADIYLEKSSPAQEISAGLQGLLAAETPNAEDETATASGDTKLSKRQKQLILMLDRGLSNRDIATELNISEHTVKVHLWRLFRRLGVKSRTQTLHFARTHGLLMS